MQEIPSTLIHSLNLIGLKHFAVSRRILKIAFAVTLFGGGAFGMLSDSTYISSSNAVISAYVVDVRSPIDGIISNLPLAAGTLVTSGQLLGDVQNPRIDRQHLDNVLTLESGSQSTVNALIAERASLEQQQKALLARSYVDTSAVASRLDQQAAAATRTLSGLQQALAEAAIELRRGQQLHDAGIIADAALDKLRSAHLIAVEQVAAQQSTLASIRSQASNATRGILTEPGDASDIAYSRQRADEIAIKLVDNANALTIARGQADESHLIAAAETVRSGLMRQSQIHSPVPGVVWKINTTNGEVISGGTSVLSVVNCNQQFVLAQIPQDRVPDVAVHREARIRLAGESEVREGTVVSVSGDALKLPDAKLAALPFQESSQQMATVLISLDPGGSPTSERHRPQHPQDENPPCLVGRTVRVLIPTYSVNPTAHWLHKLF